MYLFIIHSLILSPIIYGVCISCCLLLFNSCPYFSSFNNNKRVLSLVISVGQKFRITLDEWDLPGSLMKLHEAVVKRSASAIVIWRLNWIWGIWFQVAHSFTCGQEGPVPCQTDFSTGLLEGPHSMVSGFLWNGWSKTNGGESGHMFLWPSLRSQTVCHFCSGPDFCRSALFGVGGNCTRPWIPEDEGNWGPS